MQNLSNLISEENDTMSEERQDEATETGFWWADWIDEGGEG